MVFLGAGKSTLLNALFGLCEIKSGTVLLGNSPLTKKMRRRVSYVTQSEIFFEDLTLRDTLNVSVHSEMSSMCVKV